LKSAKESKKHIDQAFQEAVDDVVKKPEAQARREFEQEREAIEHFKESLKDMEEETKEAYPYVHAALKLTEAQGKVDGTLCTAGLFILF